MKSIQNLSDLKNAVANDANFRKDIQDDPEKALGAIPDQIPDTFIYRIVVGSLGLSIILVIVACTILLYTSESTVGTDARVPTIFTAIASGAIGALAGLLAPSPRNGQ
ncbi:MAG: hypothetical protein WBP41_18500 [Saprospiraceae bacterium]